jgi:hypothetical protein
MTERKPYTPPTMTELSEADAPAELREAGAHDNGCTQIDTR